MKDRARQQGFTLVELLTVIVIISLLLTILVPTIAGIARQSYATKTKTRIAALETGIALYYEDTGRRFYPGQQYLSQLKGGDGTTTGNWTGSQWLARCLFTQKNGDFPAKFTADPGYVGYTPDMLLPDTAVWADPPANKDNMAISDHFPDALPICYYVSRPRNGVSSTADTKLSLEQFKEDDNAAYTGANGSSPKNSTRFNDFITDPKRNNDALRFPYHDGQYLLLAPGVDRQYFTDDDVKNF